MSRWRSLRWQIAALVAVASGVVALAVGVLVHQSTLERSLALGRDRALTALLAGPADPGPLPAELTARLGGPGTFATWYDDRDPDVPWMWAADDTGAVKIDMGGDLRNLRALDRHIVLASAGVLGLVVPLAALAAELPNRRLRRVARTARRIAEGDLEARTSAGRGGDEITGIAAAVDTMAAALHDRLRAEQRFTADVAHELRTPLMGLVTSAELLPDGEVTELVRDRVGVLRVLVENLLEISRLDAGAESADRVAVPLGGFARDCVHRTGLTAEVTVHGDPIAETDPRRLDRILANLVVNAHRHGNGPVEVRVAGTTITVRDHGPGFPEPLLAEGPQRFRTGTSERGRGHGLGLTIATGQARVIGARLSFANAPGGGAVATVRLN
ncbi:HAMP domain-containing histidine kinase [Herbidospora galbida]|uniref:histidine kinase n=1 Tax=Herbidospora galbida TaxID=2575442 RepID=A0A4U3MK05_9ACTN|nr:HAMP domain-containing sensor histidine kinase [Herbidospora galbida]TKK89049.1 HAMP domain-containing histidine kinase [Herbidospora galbida]